MFVSQFSAGRECLPWIKESHSQSDSHDDIMYQVSGCHLGGEQDTADDLEDVVGPGVARVRPHHGDQVTNAKDGHHDDQRLGTEIHSLVWMTRGEFNQSLTKEKNPLVVLI